jgi:hypothetical protein
MIRYYINQSGDIVSVEQVSLQPARPVPTGQIVIHSEDILANPSDWYWSGESFALREPVAYTVNDRTIRSNQTTLMTFPNHCIIDIYGPGVSERIVAEELEFGSDIAGTYRFTLTCPPARQTVFEVKVV